MKWSIPENSPSEQNPTMGAQADFDNSELIDLTQYWRILRRNKWGIIFMTLLGLIIGGFIASSAIPVYRATSTVLADPQQSNATSNEQYIASALVFLFYETQYEIIGSRNVAESVVDKLNLVEKYKQNQEKNATNEPSGLGKSISEIKAKISAMFIKTTNEPEIPQTDEALRTSLASGIQGNLSVSGGTQSQIIDLSYTSTNPQEAADIVNAVSDAYIQFGLTTRLREVKRTETWLSDQNAQLRATLQESEIKLSDYRSQQGMVDTIQQERIVNTQLQALNSELIRAQTELSAMEEQYRAIQNVDAGSSVLYSLGPVLQNETARNMVQEEARLTQTVNELFERYGEKHPKMIAARAELKSAKDSLALEVSKVVDNIEKDYRLAEVQVDNINKLIELRRNDIQAVQGTSFSLVALEREVENNRRISENFQISLMEANVRSEYTGSNVQIIDKATVPKAPFKPNIKLIITMAGFFGAFFGLALVFLREALDNTFRTPDAIEDKLRIPALGITPVVKGKKGEVTPERQYLDDPRSPFSESINTIRTGLLFSNIDNPPRSILVTSATGAEGKSTLALNLATAYSNLGKTLLLEVDLRKPSIARYLGMENRKGLTELIMGTAKITDDIIEKSYKNNLSIITCGALPPNPVELLSSEKFNKTLNSLRKHFDYIILDGPPTLPVSDSCIVANKVDGVIFTVKAEETKISVAKEAVSRLRKLNANVIGAVLSVAEANKMSYYGDHYYSGEYYGTPQTDSAATA